MNTNKTDDSPRDKAVLKRENIYLLWAFARPHISILILGVVVGLIGTASSLATPMVTKLILDSLGTGQSLAQPITLLVVVLVIGLIAMFIQSVMLGRVAETVVYDASAQLVKRFIRAKLSLVQQFGAGELVTRITSDTVLLRESTTSSISLLINGLISLIGTVVLMALLDWVLLVVTIVAVVLIGVMLLILVPKIGQYQKLAQDETGKVGAALVSRINAIRTVKSSGAEQREISRILSHAEAAKAFSIKAIWISAFTLPVAGGGMQLAIIGILALGVWRVSIGALSVSALVAFLLYTFNLVDPIGSLTSAFMELQSGLAAAERIRETAGLDPEELDELPNKTRDDNDPSQVKAVTTNCGTPSAVIQLRDVTVTYADESTPVLNQISLDIPRTGHTAIVGPSGAGKTTVFSVLLRLIDIDAGMILLDGSSYDELTVRTVRRAMAYVEQETPVIDGSIRDNVLFRFDDGTDQEAWDALKQVQLDQKVRTLPGQLDALISSTNLSGGERQRLAVARALVRTPAVLLLDEATAQLDAVTEAAIQQVIRDQAKRGAVITIAHRLSTVQDANRIIVLESGRVRAQGSHQQLLADDELYRTFVEAMMINE
ncbi:ABC transporter ATP-binding protein [Stomatohabitans albus]|uniref:ABC transporter ATP-binding protein n=1 Tax=Stomatohabitans albus TaxID=3110766 RepID=UPI00300D6B1E